MDRFARVEAPSQTAFPIARAGYPYIFAAAFVTAVMALLELVPLALLGLATTFFICYFFRDPDRLIPRDENAIVSPADGKVIAVRPVGGDPFGVQKCLQISIFMNVFNVHVNRIPFDGTITDIQYQPGRFIAADKEQASHKNERNALQVKTAAGQSYSFVQVAGLVARRIICRVNTNDHVVRGQRFGMICFGSRLDIYLPADAKPHVAVGEKVSAGNSILGYFG